MRRSELRKLLDYSRRVVDRELHEGIITARVGPEIEVASTARRPLIRPLNRAARAFIVDAAIPREDPELLSVFICSLTNHAANAFRSLSPRLGDYPLTSRELAKLRHSERSVK